MVLVAQVEDEVIGFIACAVSSAAFWRARFPPRDACGRGSAVPLAWRLRFESTTGGLAASSSISGSTRWGVSRYMSDTPPSDTRRRFSAHIARSREDHRST